MGQAFYNYSLILVLLLLLSFHKCFFFLFYLRLSGSSRVSHNKPIDWTLCSFTHSDPVTDVIAPSPWTIFGCQNGKDKVCNLMLR